MVYDRSRTPHEADLVARAFRVLPGGTLGNTYLPQDEAVLVARGKGSHVWDVSGNEYVDYLLGSGPMVLGHAHPAVVQAARDQMDRGSTFFATNEIALYLAEELVKAIPCAEQVRFFSSGTEATFYSLRLARAYSRRDKVLKFEGGFHGMHDYAVMSLNPKDPPPFPTPHPDSAGVPRVLAQEVLVAPFNDLDVTASLIRAHRQELGAVIVEPLQRVIPPGPGFLQGLRELTARFSIPLVFDEVVTGFRLAYGGAQEYYGVVPDIAAYGKIIGGGFALAAVAARQEIMRHLDPAIEGTEGYIPQIGTLSGNPIAAAAGLATLRELQRPDAYPRLFATGRAIRQALEEAIRDTEFPAQVIGEDPLFDIVFSTNPVLDYRSSLGSGTAFSRRFNALLRQQGVFRGPSKFYISLAHTEEDVKRSRQAFAHALVRLRTGA
ncbi:MAG: aspartate aminotransferase family protein [Chloroflexi bacterium]|nr:aspartate aminotransferase family protein [Chloroflexota bacterium]